LLLSALEVGFLVSRGDFLVGSSPWLLLFSFIQFLFCSSFSVAEMLLPMAAGRVALASSMLGGFEEGFAWSRRRPRAAARVLRPGVEFSRLGGLVIWLAAGGVEKPSGEG